MLLNVDLAQMERLLLREQFAQCVGWWLLELKILMIKNDLILLKYEFSSWVGLVEGG